MQPNQRTTRIQPIFSATTPQKTFEKMVVKKNTAQT
ncbi:Uncharacterised protein [Enterobacter hormaechei]|nr:Uncharacterised protein [Enterobacter hormaechei]VAF91099.1 Uncharacterised protein [Enterobacter hormaechei]